MKTYIFRVRGKQKTPQGLSHFPLLQQITNCRIPELSGNVYILRNHEFSKEKLEQIKKDAEKQGYAMEIFELKLLY